MREHQIVITLKPDQFLEVQRLARAANAKSMGAFVRQKLLAALGIEGALGDEQNTQITVAAEGVDVEAILGDIKRVHSELKAFVAESLSPYSPEAFGQAENGELASASIAPPVVADTVSASHDDYQEIEQPVHQDELEKLADRTFAISPRLGAIGDNRPVTSNTNTNSTDDSRVLFSRHETHSRRDMHRAQHHAAPPLDAMNQSFEDEQQPLQQPISTNALDDFFTEAPIDDAPPAVPYRPQPQAPSPTPPGIDPLSKLLSKEDMQARTIPKSLPIDEDDDAFDVPLSIAERRRLLAGSDEPPVYKEPPHPSLQPTLPSEMPLETPLEKPAPAPEPAPIANEVSSSLPEEPAPAETGTTTASPQTPSPQTDAGRPLGYPPLSGSPPPKRRQV